MIDAPRRAASRAVRSGWSSLALTALVAGCATGPQDAGDARALASAEEAFAAAAQSDGVRASFLHAMADDATLFRPGPVNGKAYMTPRPDPPVRLEWRPERVTVAASGELGWSTGPFRSTAVATPDRPAYGQFFTVWRKSAAGRWEVLIDLGIEHPDPVGWQTPLELLPRDAGAAAGSAIGVAEAAFARACDDGGPAAAYRAYGATRLRLLRDDAAPIDGLDRMRDLPDAAAHWIFEPVDSGTARSSDLAWAMGRYRAVALDGTTASGTYVRVWRAERGRWKILGDVLAETGRATR